MRHSPDPNRPLCWCGEPATWMLWGREIDRDSGTDTGEDPVPLCGACREHAADIQAGDSFMPAWLNRYSTDDTTWYIDRKEPIV